MNPVFTLSFQEHTLFFKVNKERDFVRIDIKSQKSIDRVIVTIPYKTKWNVVSDISFNSSMSQCFSMEFAREIWELCCNEGWT